MSWGDCGVGNLSWDDLVMSEVALTQSTRPNTSYLLYPAAHLSRCCKSPEYVERKTL